MMHIPSAIVHKRMRRPALSINRHAKAVPTNCIKPTEMLTTLPLSKPASLKMLAALKRTALTPQNCWITINPILISRGCKMTDERQSCHLSLSLRSAMSKSEILNHISPTHLHNKIQASLYGSHKVSLH